MQEFLISHWPFLAVASVLWVIGHFSETSVFTRARALTKGKMQWFWWWGRESLELHAIVTGVIVGIFWRDPEGAGWTQRPMSMAYFGAAGVFSLFGWLLLTKLLEKLGVKTDKLKLPGESKPPTPPAVDDEKTPPETPSGKPPA